MPSFEVGGELEAEEEDDDDQEGLDQTVQPRGGGRRGGIVVGDAAVGGAEEVEEGGGDPDGGGGELLEPEEVEAGELAEGPCPDPIFVRRVNGRSSDFDGEECFVVASAAAAVVVSVPLLIPPLLKLLVLGARHRTTTQWMDPILGLRSIKNKLSNIFYYTIW